MAIITGFDNTDSSSIGSKFYLGKITGQENIGSRDSDGNPIPYYSSGDIGTLQSSVILQKFDENEFKGPEVTPNAIWTSYLGQLTDTVNFLTNNPISFNWTSALDDRQLEINFVTKILDDLWDDTVQVIVPPNGATVSGPFSQFYWSAVKNILTTHASSSFGSLGNANDTKTALEDIQASKSFIEMPSSIDTRLFNERTVQGDNNLYKLVNQIYGRDYDIAQRAFSQSFTDFDRIFRFVLSQGKNIDLLLGEEASSSSQVFSHFAANSSYENLTSGVIGNFNLITGLNLTGIQGFPTGYISGQYLKANETGLEFVSSTDAVVDFTGLTDTPSNITSVKFVRGNQAGDALEFTGIKFLEDVEDRPGALIPSGFLQLTDQNTLVWNPAGTGGDTTFNFTGSEFFTGLKDTPDSYQLNKFLRSTHVGIEYVDINSNVVSFTGLADTPSSFTADKFLKINNAANAVEYVDIPSPSVDFTGLNDTPTSYVNSSGKYLRINDSENSVEFIDISGEISSQEISWNSYLRKGDLPNASDHPGMFAYVSIDELGGNSGSAYIAHGNDWVQIFPTVPNFSFSGLVDTPASYIGSSGKFVKVSDDENGLEYANLPDPIVDFTGLTDTPASFAGQSGKYLQVNAAENSLEFVNPLFSTGSFVGFGGATVLIGLETAQPQQGWNDRQITQLQGHSGIKNLSLSNNEITLPGGKYLINAEGGVFRSKQTRIGIEFTAGDHAGQRFESRSNYAGSIFGNDQGGARGSVKTVIESQNPMAFKVVSFVGESQAATTFEHSQTDVTILDLGGDRDVLSITGLRDTPNSFNNGSGKFLQINDNEDAVQYSSLSGQISSEEIDWMVYASTGDLPSASEHHGMFAHVHSEGAAYMAHAGNWEKIYPVSATGGGGGGGSYEFCRAQVSSNSRIAHSEADVDLDVNQLATASENWIHTNTTRNTVGILVPEDGLYDVSFNIRPVTAGNNRWRDNVSFLHTALQLVKADGTNVLIQETRESKQTGNGTTLNCHLYLDNLSLDQGDFLYLRCRVYSNNTSLSWAVDDRFSFLSISKPGGGSSTSNNVVSAIIAEDGSLIDSSDDWIQSSTKTANGNYKITFKSGYFTSIPAIVVTPSSSVTPVFKHASAEYFNVTTSECEVFLRAPTDGTQIDASFSIVAHHQDGSGGGGSSSSSSNGSFGLIASKMDGINFTGELPDIIFQKDEDDLEAALILQNQISDINKIQYAANTAGTNRILRFDNSATAGNMTNNGTWTLGSNSPGPVSVQHYIDTDKAVYLGGGGGGSSTFAGLTDTPSTLTEGSGQYLKVSDDGQTIEYVDLPAGGVGGGAISAINQIQENIDNIPLIGSGVQIPDAILIKDTNATTTNGTDNLIRLDFGGWTNNHTNGNITSQHFAYETNNGVNKRWYIQFDSTDGSHISHTQDQHVKKEFTSIQGYISNDRALYFGGGSVSSSFSASSYQEHILQGNLTANNDANFSDLHFTGLETGAYYRLGGQVRFVAGFSNAGSNMWFQAYQDSFSADNIVAALNNRPGGDGDPVNATHTFNHIFKATGDLFFTGNGLDSSKDRYICGNGTKQQTFLQLEKL